MRVALVQCPPYPRDTPPFELALSAASLRRHGHEVAIFDLNNDLYHETYRHRPHWKFRLTDHSVEPSFALFATEAKKLDAYARRVAAAGPEAVVFKTENALASALAMARTFRNVDPALPLIASGTSHPDQRMIRKWKREQGETDAYGLPIMPFDWQILGEDDLALPALLSALARGAPAELGRSFVIDGKVVDASRGPHVATMDELPSYDFSDYDTSRYGDPTTLRFTVSRSCVQHCAFCQDWVAGRAFRCMSGDRWFEEYQTQHARHPHIVHFRHYDRLLNGDVKALTRFCERMACAYAEPPVAWGGDFILRPELSDDLIAMMARARCNSFGTGLESGSEQVRRGVHKGFFSNELATRVFSSCRRHAIPVSVNVMIGLPGEGRAEFLETVRFIEGNADTLSEIRLTSPTALVQPGSPFALNPGAFGLLDVEHEKWSSRDRANDYAERIRRFEEFCGRMLELRGRGVRLAVNRRVIRTPSTLRRLVEECREGVALAASQRARAAGWKPKQLERTVRLLGPWVHQLDLAGVLTRDVHAANDGNGPDHPRPVWNDVRRALPETLSGLSVLDVSCREGWFCFQFAKLGARRVVGASIEADFLRRAEFAKQVLKATSVKFLRWHPSEPFPSTDRFDAALMLGNLPYFQDPWLVLKNLSAVANILVMDLCLDDRDEPALLWGPSHSEYERFCRPKWLFTRGGLMALLAAVGYAEVEVLPISPDIGPGWSLIRATKTLPLLQERRDPPGEALHAPCDPEH